MKLILTRSVNYLAFLICLLLLLGLQTSLWRQLFGEFAPPQTWIPVLAYWTLYRSIASGWIMLYILILALSSVTATSIGTLALALNLIFLIVQLVRSRFYFPGAIFFMLTSGGICILFPFVHLALSWMLDSNPIVSFQIFHWIVATLLTMLMALLLFKVFALIDRITGREAGDLMGELT